MSSASFGDEMPYNELIAKNNSFKLQNERFKAFKAQDTEKGHFDVTFEIEGKIIHAHKSTLTPVSERFDAWLSDRWTTKDKPVKVEDSSYDNFYQFLCFIYSGFCKINRGNVFQLTDMAESYGITCFKEFCDKFLSDMEYNADNVEEMFEYATLYTLPKLIDSIKTYATLPEGDDIYREEKFLAFKKPFVQLLSTLPRGPDYRTHASARCRKESEFFESVYKWTERQVQNKAALNDDAFDLQEVIKAELETIIPNPEFGDMNYEFLLNFVVEKGFFLSAAEFGKFFVKYRDAKQYVDEDIVFKSVYELSEKQTLLKQKISSDPDNFNLLDRIKADLVEVIPHVEFYRMSESILLDFVVEKCLFTFSSAELSKFYKNFYGTEDKRFKHNAPVDNFDLAGNIKIDLVKVIPNIEFYKMDETFLLDFVVEKCGFSFSATELLQFYQGLQGISVVQQKIVITKERCFERIYNLSKKQALQKQKMSLDGDNFNLHDAINADMAKILPLVQFYQMDKAFLIDFVVGKGFNLSPTEFLYFHENSNGSVIERFVQVYELAEKQALQKQKMSSDPGNFNVADSIKEDLSEVIFHIDFYYMDEEFLMNFILEKGFVLSPKHLSKFHLHYTGTEIERLEKVHELAQKLALQKQKMSSNPDNFDIAGTIKADFVEIIPQVKFYEMDKCYLNDFVVAKGIITEEQASHVYDIHFEVENNGHRIRGTLKDNADICSFIGREESCTVRRNNIKTAKRRFLEFYLPVPSTPSTVSKMKGVEWYLCFEKDKVLTLKHHLLVKRSDYLLVEMNGDTDFELGPDGLTTLSAKFNNI